MRRIVVLLLVVLFPVISFGQFKTQSNMLGFGDMLRYSTYLGRSAMGILDLDPSRLHIQHSYQMNFASVGGKGFTQGVYLNTMTYEFKAPVALTLQWGIAHQPFNAMGASSFMQSGPFISGAQLRWRPRKNVLLQIDFSNNPYGYSPYYYRNSRMWNW